MKIKFDIIIILVEKNVENKSFDKENCKKKCVIKIWKKMFENKNFCIKELKIKFDIIIIFVKKIVKKKNF